MARSRQPESSSSSSSSSTETEVFIKKTHKKHSHKKNSHKKEKCSDIEVFSNDKKTSHKSERKHRNKKHSSDSNKSRSSKKSEKCRPKHKKNSSKSNKSGSDSSDSESEKCSFDEIYNYYKYRLVKDDSLMVAGSTSYIYAHDDDGEIIPRNYSTTMAKVPITNNVQHLYPGSPFYVREEGVYIFYFVANVDQSSQFALFVNGLEVALTRCGNNAGAGQLVVRNMIELKENDAILIRNSESTATSIQTQTFIGGSQVGNDLAFLLMKIAPASSKQYNHRKDWSEECLSRRNRYLFKKLMEKLVCDKELMMKGFNVRGSFWNTSVQSLPQESDVVFNAFQNVNGLMWNPTGTNPEQIKVLEDGVFKLFFLANVATPAQFTFFINGLPIDYSTQGVNKGASQASLRILLELKKNDIVTVRNHTSAAATLVLSANAGGLLNSISAVLTAFKIAPLCKPEFKECKLNKYHEECYEKFKEYLMHQECLQIEGSPAYLALSSDTNQSVTMNSSFDWSNTLIKKSIKHIQGTPSMTIAKDGVYDVFIDIATNEAPQLAVFINDVVDLSFVFGRDSGGSRCLGRQFIKLYKGDILTVRNYQSNITTLTTAINAGGNLVGQNCVWMLFRLDAGEEVKVPVPCEPKKDKKDKK